MHVILSKQYSLSFKLVLPVNGLNLIYLEQCRLNLAISATEHEPLHRCGQDITTVYHNVKAINKNPELPS